MNPSRDWALLRTATRSAAQILHFSNLPALKTQMDASGDDPYDQTARHHSRRHSPAPGRSPGPFPAHGRHYPDGRHVNESEMHYVAQPAKEEPVSTPSQLPTILEKYIQPCVAEMVGTIFFIATGCLSVITNASGAGTIQPALAHGFALGALISVFGKISGGHFNPAVTLAACIAGALSPILLIPYWICQLCGGMLGALMAKCMKDVAASPPVCTVGTDATLTTAANTEMIFSFLLILVVLMGAVEENSKTALAPYSIAFVVMAGILSGGTISGSCLNPARAFGPAVVWNTWTNHWLYWVAPMSCGILVGLIYRLLLGGRSQRLFLK